MKINLRAIAPPKPLYLCLTLCVCLISFTKMFAQVAPPKVSYLKIDVNTANCPTGQNVRQGSGTWEVSTATISGGYGIGATGSVTGDKPPIQFVYGNDPVNKLYVNLGMDFWGGVDAQGASYIDCVVSCFDTAVVSENGCGYLRMLSSCFAGINCRVCARPSLIVKVLPVINIQNDDRTSAIDNVYCESDKVNLSLQYHGYGKTSVSWQYRIGATGNFIPLKLPAAPTGAISGSVSFTLDDLFGDTAYKHINAPISFRAVGDYSYPDGGNITEADEGSNIFTYYFSPGAPALTSVEPALPQCAGGPGKSIVLHFNRPLNSGEIISAVTIKKNGVDLVDQTPAAITALDATNSYTWNGISGLLPADGIYTMLVEGKVNNTATCNRIEFPFDVKDRAPVTFTGTQTNVTCYGVGDGTITLTGAGGTATFSYSKDNGASWQPTNTFTGLVPGAYSMLIKDDNDCVALAAQTITISGPAQALSAAIDSYADPKGASANDGMVKVVVTGGTSPYIYSWSNGATTQNLSALGGGTYTLTVTDKNNCTASASITLVAPPAIQLLFGESAISCHGDADGAVSASVSGGVKPYSYQWSNNATTATISNVGANTYTLTVTDANGITATGQYELKAPDVVTVTPATVSTSCYGSVDGKVTTRVTGGTAPYTYLWNTGAQTTGIQPVPAGTYTVAVTDAHYCPAKATATVSSPDVLTITGQVKNPSRNGYTDGEITLTVNGGTAPYTYNWSDGGNGTSLGEGIYTIHITDANNCTVSATFNVVQPTVLTGHIDVTHIISCHGLGNGILTAVGEGGTTPYTYAWSDGNTTASIDQLTPGNYSVTITEQSGATVTEHYTLTEPTTLTLSLQATDVSCGGESNGTVTSTVNGGVTPYTYAWSNGATTANLNGINGGMYTLHVTDANGCILSSAANVTAPGALAAAATITDPLCYGNTNGSIDLQVTGGRAPYIYKWSTGATSENLPNIGAGEYSVSITDNSDCTIRQDYTLKSPLQLVVNLGSDRTLCMGQSVAINATIPDAVRYQWTSDNGFTATLPTVTLSDAGTYTVTVKDAAGCTASGAITIVKDDQPIAADFLMSTQCYTGESVIAVNVSQPAADRISWDLPAAADVVSTTDAMVEMSFKKPGTYNVYMTAYKADCELTTVKDLIVVDGVDLPEVNTNHTSLIEKALVKPNPNNGQFVLEIQADEDITVNYRLLDIQRNLVVYERKGSLSKEVLTDEQFNISNLMPGVYVLLVETSKEKKALKVLIL